MRTTQAMGSSIMTVLRLLLVAVPGTQEQLWLGDNGGRQAGCTC